jgi:signal transduction histidine kinase
VLAIAGVAAVAVLLFAIPLGLVLAQSYRDRELLVLQRDTVAATRRIDVAPGGPDPIELPPSRDVLGVYDRRGALVAGRGPTRADGAVVAALRGSRPVSRTEDGRLVTAVPLVVRERVAGVVRAERPDAAVERSARDAWLLLGGLAAAVVAGAAVAAIVLGRRLARPLERLAVAAGRLGDGEFTVRAPRAAIPEVDAVSTALEATAERLDHLLARERAFTANASHQLRTPLQALRIELEGMELRGDSAAELPAALSQVDRLQATVDTLLDLARDAPRRAGRTELGAVLEELESRWRGPLAAEGRPLHVENRARHTTAAASGPVVCEIVDVLVANARRHGSGVVTIAARDVGGWLALDVADEGEGFHGDPEDSFARRVDADRHGIGLALARSLADAEGLRLSVTRAGPGPVLTLLLPVAE